MNECCFASDEDVFIVDMYVEAPNESELFIVAEMSNGSKFQADMSEAQIYFSGLQNQETV